MIETNAPLVLDTSKQSYASWAVKKPRRSFSVAGIVSNAIIRVRPLLLVNLALMLCAVSGAGMFLAASYALRGTA